eukprot:TRINITY_DN1371_c0_g1_i14.p1 TRINITY_DN1371_c0_g1~~TRINITY_DN1371_c0_g1_i14.p1  ORF type:complete len:246 (-),score=49.47 TRINITY_DN1371_c0_g1_i14:447-1091(-)
MLRSLVGSEMCIRDRYQRRVRGSWFSCMGRCIAIPAGLAQAVQSCSLRYADCFNAGKNLTTPVPSSWLEPGGEVEKREHVWRLPGKANPNSDRDIWIRVARGVQVLSQEERPAKRRRVALPAKLVAEVHSSGLTLLNCVRCAELNPAPDLHPHFEVRWGSNKPSNNKSYKFHWRIPQGVANSGLGDEDIRTRVMHGFHVLTSQGDANIILICVG